MILSSFSRRDFWICIYTLQISEISSEHMNNLNQRIIIVAVVLYVNMRLTVGAVQNTVQHNITYVATWCMTLVEVSFRVSFRLSLKLLKNFPAPPFTISNSPPPYPASMSADDTSRSECMRGQSTQTNVHWWCVLLNKWDVSFLNWTSQLFISIQWSTCELLDNRQSVNTCRCESMMD